MKIIMINAMWCPGCIKMHKTFEEIKKRYNDFLYEILDYDLDEEKVSMYNVKDILPVMIFEKEDKEICRIVGEKNEDEIIKKIEECL